MDSFIKDTRKFVNSLVLKEFNIGILAYYKLFSNKLISKEEANLHFQLLQRELDPEDVDIDDPVSPELLNTIKNNKYYQNLYGELHYTDSPVMIKLIETNYEAELSKDLLEQYKDTKKELLLCGDYYNNIVSNNFEMVDYIHGCMYPVDPVVTHRTSNGTILNYNSNFIEEQEDYLISELNTFTTNFLGVSLPRGYMENNTFYVPSYLFILRNFLLPITIGARLSKMNTMYAHKFLVGSKFRSTLDIWEEIQNLNNKTLWWLYANIDSYVAHMGTNETFTKLLDNVLAENSIGIGTYRFLRRNPDPVLDQYDYTKPSFELKEVVANTKKLNKAYNANEDMDISVKSLNQELVDLTSSGNADEDVYNVEKSTKFVLDNYTGVVDTKVTEISTLENFTSYNFDIFKVLLDYWAYFLNNDLYGSFKNDIPTVYVDFQDPNTLQHYSIDSKLGFLITMKVLMHAAGRETLQKAEFTISNVLNWTFSLKDVMDKSIFQDGYTAKLFNTINDILPSEMKATSSISEVSNYLNSVLSFFKKYWLLTSNVENQIVSANLYRIIHVLTLQEEAYFKKSISVTDIDDILLENGITFTINGDYNHMLTLNELLKSCLGVEPNSDIKLKDLLASYKSLISKMKSYTVEVIGKVKSENKSSVCYQHITPLFSKVGMLKLFQDKVDDKLLEQEYYFSKFEVYEPNEKVKCVPYLEKIEIEMTNPTARFALYSGSVNVIGNGLEIEILN